MAVMVGMEDGGRRTLSVLAGTLPAAGDVPSSRDLLAEELHGAHDGFEGKHDDFPAVLLAQSSIA